ncbi:MAG: hypothetical protein AB8B72_02900 [Crocinitomicaceae bacterium]
MNKLIFFSIFLIVVSCTETKKSSKPESFGKNKSLGTVTNCPCDSIRENAYKILMKDGKPYTGICYTNYPDTEIKYIEKQILDGELNGTITYFSRSGEVLYEEKFEQGNFQVDLKSEDIKCDCLDLKRKKESKKIYFKGQVFEGTCFSNFPETEQPYMEINYKNGLRDGYTKYYSKSGSILYTEMYDKDSLMNIIYPKKEL